MPASTPPVGIVGLGNIGGAIAANLVASGTPVVGYDIDPDAHAGLAKVGGEPVPAVSDVADRAGIVLTCLPSVSALDAVVDEIAGRRRDGALVVETSTFPLEDKVRARDRLAGAGIAALDCPLSGTAMQARNRDVVVYASGAADDLARARPVFDGFARATYELGEYGQGTKMKMVANLLVAVHNVAAAEAVVLAQQAGLDLAQALEVLTDGAGASRMLEVRGPMMAGGTYDQPGMNVGVFQKDIQIIGDFARQHSVPTPLLAASGPIYSAAAAHGWGGCDTASVYAVLAEFAGAPRVPTERDH